jgi:hypothetical protein
MLARSSDGDDRIDQLVALGQAAPASGNEQELVTHGVVVPEVVRHLVPDKGRLVGKSPRLVTLIRRVTLQDARYANSGSDQRNCDGSMGTGSWIRAGFGIGEEGEKLMSILLWHSSDTAPGKTLCSLAFSRTVGVCRLHLQDTLAALQPRVFVPVLILFEPAHDAASD